MNKISHLPQINHKNKIPTQKKMKKKS